VRVLNPQTVARVLVKPPSASIASHSEKALHQRSASLARNRFRPHSRARLV